MDKGMVALIAAVVCSALLVVTMRHESRLAFARLTVLEQKRDELNIEWGKLLLEQGTWSQNARIEKLARTRLDMNLPDPDRVVMMDLRSQTAMNTGGAH